MSTQTRTTANSNANSGFLGFAGFIGAWNDRARQRRNLAGLDRRLLRDIGVNAQDRAAECNKPFWRG